jgi:hypothetical protein
MADGLEKLAYDEALRALDKQERLLEELRARTGMLLAASSLAVSFLGPSALLHPSSKGLALLALAAFALTLGASLFVLIPKRSLTFASAGTGIYEGFYAIREDMAEVHRRLAYELHAYWKANEEEIASLGRAFTFAAAALVAEIFSMSVLLGGSLL